MPLLSNSETMLKPKDMETPHLACLLVFTNFFRKIDFELMMSLLSRHRNNKHYCHVTGTGVWGRSLQHSKIFAFFCKNNLILGLL